MSEGLSMPSERAFTFFLHDGSGTPPAFEIAYCDGIETARRHGAELLKERTRYSAVEITDGLETLTLERSF